MQVRVPTIARWIPGRLPQVHHLHVRAGLARELFPDEIATAHPAGNTSHLA